MLNRNDNTMRPEDYPEGFSEVIHDSFLEAARDFYGKEDISDEELESFDEYQRDLAEGQL